MRVEIKDNIRIIKNHSDAVEEIFKKIDNQLKSFLDLSLILDLSFNTDLDLDKLKLFQPINKAFKKANLSFIIVNSSLNLSDISEKIVVSPTILEAHDLIQLDDIQRELGF